MFCSVPIGSSLAVALRKLPGPFLLESLGTFLFLLDTLLGVVARCVVSVEKLLAEALSHFAFPPQQGVGIAVALLPRPHLILSVCSIGCRSEFCRIFHYMSTLAVF